MTDTTAQLSQKADLALSQLTANGGLLNPAQNDTFIRNLIDAPSLLNAIRVYPMNGPTAEINKIGFGSRILRAARNSAKGNTSANDAGGNDRYVRAADRAAPTTGKISLETQEVIAEIRIPYEVLEDNIEQGGMANTVLALIAERAALDLEELVLLGDKGLSATDPYLGLIDGVLKRASQNVFDAGGEAVQLEIFNEAKKQIPTAYRRVTAQNRFFSHPDIESDYRVKFAQRQTQGGDQYALGAAPIPVLGSGLVGAALMPMDKMIYTNPQNIIFGVQRNIRIEQDRDIRAREVIIVLTARVDVQIEALEAISKVVNLGDAAWAPGG